MGKFSRSFQLVKQSFAILRSDKQLMLFPILSAICCLFVTLVIATGGTILMLPARTAALAAGEPFHPNQSPLFLLGMFTLYVANYFVIVFFNVALVGVANVAASPDWKESAKRLVDILIAGSRPAK